MTARATSSPSPPLAGATPLIGVAAVRAADGRARDDFAMHTLLLMERAALAVSREVLRQYGHLQAAIVLVGTGNNGGDGYAIARHLLDAGWTVRIASATLGTTPSTPDARRMAEIAKRLGLVPVPIVHVEPPLGDVVIVDALVGTAASGPPRADLAAAIAWTQGCAGPIVSVDLPSGVDADSGQVPGAAVNADLTVTLHADKIGLHVSPGRQHAGRVLVADIGIPRAITAAPAAWLLGADVLAALPSRAASADKYAGAAMLIAGAPGMAGAATLCARAAMRAGAGLLVAVTPESQVAILTGGVTEAVVVGIPGRVLDASALNEIRGQAGRVGAVAIGPGIGRAPETGALVSAVVAESTLPLVIDADALWHLTCAQIATCSSPTVITPHTGEAARLLGVDRDEVDSSRLASACELARQTGAVVVLKGPGTIIASPDGTVCIDAVGGPELATAGSGDVLTGITVALLASGTSPIQAACLSTVAHGVAGQRAGRGSGTLASDIVEALPEALNR